MVFYVSICISDVNIVQLINLFSYFWSNLRFFPEFRESFSFRGGAPCCLFIQPEFLPLPVSFVNGSGIVSWCAMGLFPYSNIFPIQIPLLSLPKPEICGSNSTIV